MDSLLKQYDDWLKEEIGNLERKLKASAKEILKAGLDIFKGYIPIDTRKLQKSLFGEIIESNSGLEVVIGFRGQDLNYGGRLIGDVKLALILERGRGRNGVRLKRTQSNKYAKEGQPTEAWFSAAEEAWNQVSNSIIDRVFI